MLNHSYGTTPNPMHLNTTETNLVDRLRSRITSDPEFDVSEELRALLALMNGANSSVRRLANP